MIKTFLNNLITKGLESLGRYYSSYRGLVVDTNDPENMGRIKVCIPKVSGNTTHPAWAYPKGNFQGKDFGINLPLSKGDLVWVEFEFGDPEFPLYSFGHYTTNDKPTIFTDKIYGIKTRHGHIILVDEKDDSIKILQKDGLEIIILDKKIQIKNEDYDIKTLLVDLIGAIRNIKAQTNNGPTISPLINDSDFSEILTNLNKLLF